MLEELGSDPKAREATKLLEPERALLLLEKIRMRDLQANVSIHVQNWKKYL